MQTLPRHLKEAEGRNAADLDACAVVAQRFLHAPLDGGVVASFVHVDEVDDDEAAEHDARQDHVLAGLAAIGLVPDRPPIRALDKFYLWPDNHKPFNLFMGLCTQWIMGSGGPTGLNHAELHRCVIENSPSGHRKSAVDKREALKALLLAAEDGALKGFDDKRQARQAEAKN